MNVSFKGPFVLDGKLTLLDEGIAYRSLLASVSFLVKWFLNILRVVNKMVHTLVEI